MTDPRIIEIRTRLAAIGLELAVLLERCRVLRARVSS